MVRKHVQVWGRVQGVFFRDAALRRARELGITGWVRNVIDGSLEALLEGDEESVASMVDWFASGPSSAEVREMEVRDMTAHLTDGHNDRENGEVGFRILPTTVSPVDEEESTGSNG